MTIRKLAKPYALILEVRRLAANNPMFIYKNTGLGCSNVPNEQNECGCIVGQAIENLTPGFFERHPQHEDSPIVSIFTGNIHMPDLRWLANVQREQDGGTAWGEAVAEADRLDQENRSLGHPPMTA